MIKRNTWWYSMIRDFQEELFKWGELGKMSAEERLELRKMLQDTIRRVDDLACKR